MKNLPLKNTIISSHKFISFSRSGFLFSFLLIAVFLASCSTYIERNVFIKQDKIDPVSFEIRNKNIQKASITYSQLLKDLDAFCYIFPSVYAGYDDAVEKGLDLEYLCNKIKKNHFRQSRINCDELTGEIENGIRKYIDDGHLCFTGGGMRTWINPDCYRVKFSDVYVKAAGNMYIVTEGKEVKPGTVYSGSNSMVFHYPSKGKYIYRLGCALKADRNSFNAKFGNNVVELAVEEEIETADIFNSWLKYGFIETKDSVYYSINTFAENNNALINELEESELEAFKKNMKCALQKKNVIVDLRKDVGGLLHFSSYLPYYLYSGVFEENIKKSYRNFLNDFPEIYNVESLQSSYEAEKFIALYGKNVNDSPYGKFITTHLLKSYGELAGKGEINRYHDYLYRFRKTTKKKSAFTGKLIIITDMYSASASEFFILDSLKLLDDSATVILIGRESCGADEYVNVEDYYLPESGIEIYCGSDKSSKMFEGVRNYRGETKGFYPDMWCDNSDLLETILYATEDQELESALHGIEERVLLERIPEDVDVKNLPSLDITERENDVLKQVIR